MKNIRFFIDIDGVIVSNHITIDTKLTPEQITAEIQNAKVSAQFVQILPMIKELLGHNVNYITIPTGRTASYHHDATKRQFKEGGIEDLFERVIFYPEDLSHDREVYYNFKLEVVKKRSGDVNFIIDDDQGLLDFLREKLKNDQREYQFIHLAF